MVRGCQKKIIYLKNTQSNIFEEAYFVIKDNMTYDKPSEYNMVEEANRILNESFEIETNPKISKKIFEFIKKHIVTFLLGIISGVLFMLVL